MSRIENENETRTSEPKLIKKKLDENFGLLSDEIIAIILDAYSFKNSWLVLPFININNMPVPINKRSETAKKAIILYDHLHYILKEVPWYCAIEKQVRYKINLQVDLQKFSIKIPDIIKTYTGNNYWSLEQRTATKFFVLQEFCFGSSWTDKAAQNTEAAINLAKMHLAMSSLYKKRHYQDKSLESDIFKLAIQLLNIAKDVLEENQECLAENDIIIFQQFYDIAIADVLSAKRNAEFYGYYNLKHPVHGDYNPWNLIFEENGKVAATLDFDNCIIDNPVHDIAEFIINYCFIKFRLQVMRYGEPPSEFNTEKAIMLLKTYCEIYGDGCHKILNLLTSAAKVITLELFALGLVRGDYNLRDIPMLLNSLPLLINGMKNVIKSVNNLSVVDIDASLFSQSKKIDRPPRPPLIDPKHSAPQHGNYHL